MAMLSSHLELRMFSVPVDALKMRCQGQEVGSNCDREVAGWSVLWSMEILREAPRVDHLALSRIL
jgi:hypothetical protein